MTEIPGKEVTIVMIMVFLLLILIPILQSRTDKDLTQMFFGIRRRKKPGEEMTINKKKEPRVHNGTKGELTSFIAQMIRFTAKNGMRLVAPGTVSHNGQTARLTALIVAPGGITGIYCLGFGGTISPGDIKAPAGISSPWRQHINGEDKTFDNPLKSCQQQKKLVQEAMEKAGIHTDLNVVTVFTNPRAVLTSTPTSIYTPKSLCEYLKNNDSLKAGSLDIHSTALALADLAGIKKGKEQKSKNL